MHQKECAALPKQPTPRKGTETRPFQTLSRGARETTHTPQGDGNRGIIQSESNPRETTHTPQGDGNLGDMLQMIKSEQKQPTPRKGTETLIPFVCFIFVTKQPTPRKGTETQAPRDRQAVERNNPHPARGRKLLDHDRSLLRCETTHTPQGDGNRRIQLKSLSR